MGAALFFRARPATAPILSNATMVAQAGRSVKKRYIAARPLSGRGTGEDVSQERECHGGKRTRHLQKASREDHAYPLSSSSFRGTPEG